LVVVIDPERGATIDHIGQSLDPKDNILAHYVWDSPMPARNGPGYGSSTMDWLSEYRGGWQVLTPSAGAESVTDGVLHPFHSEVSRAKWRVVDFSRDTVTLAVGTHGPLKVVRELKLSADRPRVSVWTTVSNDSPVAAPAIFVEHIAFKGDEHARVLVPEKSVWRHDSHSPEAAAAGGNMSWLDSGMVNPVGSGEFRLSSLLSGSEGWAEFYSPQREGRTVRVEWDPLVLPHMWHWQERGSPGFPWYARADISAIEPSSVSISDGLEAAIERGEAWMLGPGESKRVEISIELSEGQHENGVAS
jgi:hypothetical protein